MKRTSDPLGPCRLPMLGPSEISERLNLGSETAVYGALGIISHCRQRCCWLPFTLTAVKKALAKGEWPEVVHDFLDLRDAGFVQKVYGRISCDLEQLFQILPAFKIALFRSWPAGQKVSPVIFAPAQPKPIPVIREPSFL